MTRAIIIFKDLLRLNVTADIDERSIDNSVL